MNELLVDPSVVLVVGDSAADPFDVESVVSDGTATDVVTVADLDRAAESLRARDDVGCVLVLDTGEDPVTGAPDRLRQISPDLPILVHVAGVDGAPAGELARWTDCRYLPRETPPETVREAVDDALATFERRRDERYDSKMFQTLLEESGFGVFAKDDQGRYVRTTALTETHDRSDIVGKTDRDVFGRLYPRTVEATFRDDLEVVETGEPIHGQRERFGNDFWSETTKLPVRDDDGEVQGLVGTAFDATNAVENERKLAEQSRRFDQFAGYVSHDLRTPLQIAYGALQQAREGDEAALDKLENAHDRIEEIIDDLRQLTEADVSPEESDLFSAHTPAVESTNLGTLVRKIWRVIAPEPATLELDFPGETVVVTGDEVLRPLVENLLKNAVDHGGSDVTVRVGLTDGRGFYVADDGPGIPADERECVRRQGYTTSDDGTGTGLAIVDETVMRQGWTLSITDSVVGGARIEISDCPVVVPVDATVGETVELSTSTDVGNVAVAGEAEYDAATDRWRVVGGGADVWSDVEEFHVVAADVDGPVRIQAHVAEFEAIEEYSKAGVTVQDSLEPGSSFGYVGATGGHGSEVIWREQMDALATSVQLEEPPEAYSWYRVERVDGTVTCSLSPDGEEWFPVDQRSVDLADPVAVGLVVCSHSEEESCEATFDEVTVNELD